MSIEQLAAKAGENLLKSGAEKGDETVKQPSSEVEAIALKAAAQSKEQHHR